MTISVQISQPKYLTIQGRIVDDELRPDLADLLAFQERQEPAKVLQVQRVSNTEVGVGVGSGGGAVAVFIDNWF